MYDTGILSVFWSLPFTCIAISTIASSEVDISDNITEEIYATDITLNCSFNLRTTDRFGSISLTAQNVSDTFIEIAGAFGKEDPQLVSFGEYLFGNETTLLKKKNSFVLTITNLTCRHERLYQCILNVRRDGGSKLTQVKSDTMSISVTVHPSKLKLSSAMLQYDLPKSDLQNKREPNASTSGKQNKQSVAQMTEDDIQEMTFNEGQNITFICDADIGRPKGRFVWQKISFDDSKVNYSTTATDTIQESCSYNGTSNLTIQLTATDNKAKIRCIVKSDVSRMEVFEESEPLDIHYKVRQPSISAPTTEFVFFEGDSIELECEAEGNPKPHYAWIKGNNTNETFAYSEKLVIKGASIDDTGIYTCEAHNSVDDIIYKEYISEYIHIEKHTSTPVPLDILLPIVSGVILLVVVMATLKACNKIFIHRSGEGKPKGKKTPRIYSIHDHSSFTPDGDDCLLENKEMDKVKLSTTENSCDNSPDHYASSVLGIYDQLHDNRHKTDNGETFDKMFELKRLHEERNESKQQTNGDPESSITIVQNGSYTNPAFAIKDIQNEDANSSTFRSTDGLQNDGEINQNNDTQPKNDYEMLEVPIIPTHRTETLLIE